MKKVISLLLLLLSFSALAESQAVIYLYGPQSQRELALVNSVREWRWPGGCLSCSAQRLYFNQNLSIKKAVIEAYWIPLNNGWIRVGFMDDGLPAPVDIWELISYAQFDHPDRDDCCPIIHYADITKQMQNLASHGVNKILGYQVHGGLELLTLKLTIIYY